MYARVPVHIATSYKHTLIQKLSKPRRTAIKGGMGGYWLILRLAMSNDVVIVMMVTVEVEMLHRASVHISNHMGIVQTGVGCDVSLLLI